MAPAADIQERKLELIQWLSIVDDASVLEKIADVRAEDARNRWNEISQAEKDSISKGIADAELGKLNPHSDARAVYEKWL